MMYVLDTDVFTLAELRDSPEYQILHRRVLELDAADLLVTTIVTCEEQTRGWLAYAAKSCQTSHQGLGLRSPAKASAHVSPLPNTRIRSSGGLGIRLVAGLETPCGNGGPENSRHHDLARSDSAVAESSRLQKDSRLASGGLDEVLTKRP